MSSFGSRLSDAFAAKGQLCIGIDPSQQQLSNWSLPDSAFGAREFALEMLDACVNRVGIVKPQVSFFEQFGPAGLTVLTEILLRARQAGLLVIADAKRGDIGSSMTGYTRAWLSEEASFEADALTLSPFLGVESLRPAVETALQNNKGVFLLSATSNPEALAIQSAIRSDVSIASQVAAFASSFNNSALGSVGCVVGATVSFTELGLSESSFANTPVLMPGFGAQGVALEAVGRLFGPLGDNLICSVSRSVAGESREGLVDRISQSSTELREGMIN